MTSGVPYQPLVSVIVPVYNVAADIEQCIRSVIQQRYSQIELILVDDCGTDNSVELATNLLKNSSLKWKLVQHTANRGLSAARNSGVDAATGDYLFFLDSDDFLDDKAISLLIAKAQETQAEIVFGNYLNYYNIHETKPGYATRTDSAPLESNPLKGYINASYAPMAWGKLIKTVWYKNTSVRFIEGILHEDEPWSLELSFLCKRIAYVNDIIYYYRQREGSIMLQTTNVEKKLQSHIEWVKIAHAHIKDVEKQKVPLADYTIWLNARCSSIIRQIALYKIKNSRELINNVFKYSYKPKWRENKCDTHCFLTSLRFFSKIFPIQLAYFLSRVIRKTKQLLHL